MRLCIHHCVVARGQCQPRDLLLFTAALLTHKWTDSGHFEFISQAKVGQVQSEYPTLSGSELTVVAAVYVYIFLPSMHACFQFEMNGMCICFSFHHALLHFQSLGY